MTSYIMSRDHLEEMPILILAKWMKFTTLLSFIQTYSGKKVGGFFLSFSKLWRLTFAKSSPPETWGFSFTGQSVVISQDPHKPVMFT